jgi:uncharacterized phage protein (TIGR01671 family)
MREYKFRGKRKDNGEWVYGDLLHHSHWKDGSYWIRYFDEEHQCFVSVKVDPDTVGEFAGRYDKNGNEVYEKDIVAFEVWHGGVEHIIAEMEAEKQGKKINWVRPHVILFNKYGAFCMKPIEFIDDESWYGYEIPDADKIEIIGTVHDNPELLKEGNV